VHYSAQPKCSCFTDGAAAAAANHLTKCRELLMVVSDIWTVVESTKHLHLPQ